MCELIELHAAPEFFCTDLAFLELAAPGTVRFGLLVEYPNAPSILRVKLLLPVAAVPRLISRTTTFIAAGAVQCIGAQGAVLM